MSFGARVALSVVCAIIAIGFLAVALTLGPRHPLGPWPFFFLTAFCLVISIACLSRASRPIALRLIAIPVFLITAWYVYDERNNENLVNALTAFVVFGLPAGFVVVTGHYPSWGEHTAAFEGDFDEDEPE